MRYAYAIHSTGISFSIEPRRSAVLAAFEKAKSESIVVSFDGSFPPHRDNDAKTDAVKAMKLADCVKLNLFELLFWTDSAECAQSAMNQIADAEFRLDDPKVADLNRSIDRFMDEYAPKVLFLTLSQHGSFVISRSLKLYCPPISVKACSSIGAGDGFVAGILTQFLNRQITLSKLEKTTAAEWAQIVRYANAVGALSTRKLTALDSYPYATEVDALLAMV